MGIWSNRHDDSFQRLMEERARKLRLRNEMERRELKEANDALEQELHLRQALAR